MKTLVKSVLLTSLMALTTVAMAEAPVNAAAMTQTVTVKQALTLKDDTNVQVKGYVVKSIGDEKYQFRDSTGTITVDIDDDLWQGKPVSAKTPVALIGEIDIDYKPMKRVEIDVEHVQF